MKAFVSHDFDDKPQFDNVVDWLARDGVAYWDPREVTPGKSLRDQLREAVSRCSVCVFVATRRSVESSWCGAELGAFWGAGKPIIVYMAESLSEEELPPIVRGDVWERRISTISHRVKELVAQSSGGSVADPVSVGSMTSEQLAKLIQSAVALATAAGKDGGHDAAEAISEAARGSAGRVLEGIRATERIGDESSENWRRQVLWVDDRPDNNAYERKALEALGLQFTLALSTADALNILAERRFGAIISDMGRKEGPREGYVLLEALRETDTTTPFFIYAGSRALSHRREAAARGAQGTTNTPEELFDMVINAVRVTAPTTHRE
ncbi:MAG: TIR domain-containing protein [Acidobacteriota bacterium]|nr:TIR domain-containing protein [Acidobacteriota bacterium]